MAHAIIAAAGSGERLRAGGPKALVEVAGEPMLAWSLRADGSWTPVRGPDGGACDTHVRIQELALARARR